MHVDSAARFPVLDRCPGLAVGFHPRPGGFLELVHHAAMRIARVNQYCNIILHTPTFLKTRRVRDCCETAFLQSFLLGIPFCGPVLDPVDLFTEVAAPTTCSLLFVLLVLSS